MPKPARKAQVRYIAGPDADEEESLAIAAAKLKELSPGTINAEAVAYSVISTWIMERCKRAAGQRLTETVVFDLSDAQMRGIVENALPNIGEALAHLSPTTPLFQMSKNAVVDVFCAGIGAWRATKVAMGENPSFPLEDPVPFSDNIPF